MEHALAERVALCTWRLNRVVAYETESLAHEQEGVLEEVRKDREHTLKFASVYPKQAKDIIAGTMLEELVDDPGELSDYAVAVLSPPEVALEGVENARKHYESVLTLFDGASDAAITIDEAGWILEKGPYYAAEGAAVEKEDADDVPDDERASDDEIMERAFDLVDKLYARIEGRDVLTVSELKSHLAWMAEQAGMQDSIGVDGTVAYTPLESLLEKLHTVAFSNLKTKERQARNVERQILGKRRARILPSAGDIGKIGRYEAHLSRELYRALHELEALQERRGGGKAPLARLDVQT